MQKVLVQGERKNRDGIKRHDCTSSDEAAEGKEVIPRHQELGQTPGSVERQDTSAV